MRHVQPAQRCQPLGLAAEVRADDGDDLAAGRAGTKAQKNRSAVRGGGVGEDIFLYIGIGQAF